MQENIYGSAKRLRWINSYLNFSDAIVEIGCGTGYMITLPLALAGYDIIGIDIDAASIHLGQQIFQQYRITPELLKNCRFQDFVGGCDVIIVSEVLEHLTFPQISLLLAEIRQRLRPGGKLLLTVPNGYGWFELESYLWYRARLGIVLNRLCIPGVVRSLKQRIYGDNFVEAYPSSLSNSPHIQKFSYYSIRNLLEQNGFKVIASTGSVLFCGPFTNFLFSGVLSIMKLNCALGQWFPELAAGYYLACEIN